MKTVLIGSVYSSNVVLKEMIALNFPVNMVFSLDEHYSKDVSGYYPIHQTAAQHNIPYKLFKKINDEDNVRLLQEINPDYIFVIGLSQIVGKSILSSARKGVIGSHPTPLPKFRGRAAMVWQILLGIRESKVTMFYIDEGMDSGDIIAQEPYYIDDKDYAEDLDKKGLEALSRLARKVLLQILTNSVSLTKQNENEATYLLKRTPEDGQINWHQPVKDIQRLIRAVSRPYPGAFSYYEGKHQVIFWKADFEENKKYIGIPGQIAELSNNEIIIVCVDGLLRVFDYTNIDDIKFIIGHKFKWSE